MLLATQGLELDSHASSDASHDSALTLKQRSDMSISGMLIDHAESDMVVRTVLLCLLVVGCTTTTQKASELGQPLGIVGVWDCELLFNRKNDRASITAHAAWTEVLHRDGHYSLTGEAHVLTVNSEGQTERAHVEMIQEGKWSITPQKVSFKPKNGKYIPKDTERLSQAMAAEKHQKQFLAPATHTSKFKDEIWMRKNNKGSVVECQRTST